MLLFALAGALGNLTASLLLESGVLTLHEGMLLFAALLAANGVLWLGLVVPRERRAEAFAGPPRS